MLDIIWLIFVGCFWKLFFSLKYNNQIILMCVFLLIPKFFVPIIMWSSAPLVLAFGTPAWRALSNFVFSIVFEVKINEGLLPDKPTIFLCNYPSSILEYSLNTLLHKKICLVIASNSLALIAYSYLNIIRLPSSNAFDYLESKVVEKMAQGFSIWVYVERDWKKRSSIYNTSGVVSGIFKIAKNINATITPVVFDHFDNFCGIIDSFKFSHFIDETRYVTNVGKEMRSVTKLFKRKLDLFKCK